MEREILHKYISGDCTPDEEKAVVDWVEQDPGNQEELNRLWFIEDAISVYASQARKRRILRRVAMMLGFASAVAALVAGVWFLSKTVAVNELSNDFLSLTAQPGQRINLILHDGTAVCLNSGSTIEYPMIFSSVRRVKLSGEAMFEVAHDEAQPFVVETGTCNVEVLGTRFDVDADERTGNFSAALFEGRVKIINNLRRGEEILLNPNERAELSSGRLLRSPLKNPDDYLWSEGKLNLVGHDFPEIMRMIEKTFGVRIHMELKEMPSADIIRGCIPVDMGLDYTLRSLQVVIPFDYERKENILIIRPVHTVQEKAGS